MYQQKADAETKTTVQYYKDCRINEANCRDKSRHHVNHERIKFIAEMVRMLWPIKLAFLFLEISHSDVVKYVNHPWAVYNRFRSYHPTRGQCSSHTIKMAGEACKRNPLSK